ncbi:MAG: hypothetical protein KAS32_02315, partial [Candidatus Peribacteraceae bacterium]|nr:hypothetical protein [Candidatus Peribacteraceae bacterium]
MKYPKINTLWKREGKEKQGVIIENDFSLPEFEAIKLFEVTEKINGRNTRITYDTESNTIKFDGRGENSQIPSSLISYLISTFTTEKLADISPESHIITLFGEGYGPRMAHGSGKYRSDVSFALFDINIDGWWLKHPDITDIARKLSISCVPYIGTLDIPSIVSYIKSKPQSVITT